ncbi:MAG: choice-of-anchor B family protein [Planctomycetota bacterium]
MPRWIRLSAVAVVAATICSALLWTHPDDPKIRDRQPAYQGPGYRAGDAALPGGGGGYGTTAVDFDSSGVTLLSWLPLSSFGSPASGADCWGYVSPSGREYAIFCHADGTSFVEITNPSSPQVVGTISGPNSLWRDVKIYQNFAYAVSEGGSGIQVINLANIDSGSVSLVRQVTTPGTTATHNIAINEDSGFLYRCGGDNNGLRIYSLANPSNPSYVGQWSTRYVHDAQIVTMTSGPWAGREIAFCCSGFNGGFSSTGLDVLDVTDKGNIQVLDNFQYSAPAYSHQCWLSEDRTRLYLNDELDESGSNFTRTIVLNVSTLNNVSQTSTFTNTSRSVGHNLYVKGDLLFEANYRSGLRIFDKSNQNNPVEVAYFDTYPDSDSAEFNGLWSNFPYFPSGTVIGSDMERGLFVWWIGNPLLTYAYPNGQPANFDPAGDTIDFQVVEDSPGQLALGTVQFLYDNGSGFTSASLQDLGNGFFRATIPPTSCGQTIQYYVTAQSNNGIQWNDPPTAPNDTHQAVAGVGVQTIAIYDMETTAGWTGGIGGDNASTGIWTRVNPNGTSAQPEDDHTPNPATQCWVTGQGSPGGGVGDNDVDGGTTTLLSPVFDLSGANDPIVSYWRWYSNDQGAAPNSDTFVVQVSANGSSWVNAEIVGPSGPETSGGWIFHQIRVTDFVALTSNFRIRFRASDLGDGSIVEAAIDDFEIVDTVCFDCNGNGIDDTVDIGNGTSQDCNQNGQPDECESLSVLTISDDKGSYGGGETVSLFGEGFSGTAPTVTFGGVASANVTVINDGEVSVVVPSIPKPPVSTSGSGTLRQGQIPSTTVDVVLTNCLGQSTLTNAYTYRGRKD